MNSYSPIVTWDERKNAINQKKHKLAFELAQYVFDDPRHLVENNGIVDSEQRWLAIGRIGAATVIVVAHTYQDDDGQEYIRLISARKAESIEVKRYEI